MSPAKEAYNSEKFRAQVGKSFVGPPSEEHRYFVLTRSRFRDDFIRGVGDSSRVVSFRSV